MRFAFLLFTTSLFANDFNQADQSITHPEYGLTSSDHVTTSAQNNFSTTKEFSCFPSEGLVLSLDFLWWKGQNEGFFYTLTQNSANVDFVLIRNQFEWAPGFRFGLGWNTPFDHWQLLANWTYYHNHTKDQKTKVATSSDLGLVPIWATGEPVALAEGGWRFNYNMIDFEWARAYYWSSHVNIRFHFGARGGWLHQTYTAFYDQSPNPAQNFPAHYTGKENFWGIGPRAGLDTTYLLGANFQLMGQLATALLAGSTKMTILAFQQDRTTGLFLNTIHGFDRFRRIVPNLQLAGGAAWGICFYQDKMFFNLKILYEMNFWFDQFNTPLVGGGGNVVSANKPVIMQGLTCNASFDS